MHLNRNQYGICSFINVIPAQAGIQGAGYLLEAWIPAFAGMTETTHPTMGAV